VKKEQKEQSAEQPQKQLQYNRPELRRWGTLRELTEGGGGTKSEPGGGKFNTRF
jgi:hypothetical protein